MSQNGDRQPVKKRTPRICEWLEGKCCKQWRQTHKHRFCNTHYNIWLSQQGINNNGAFNNTATAGGGAPLINHGTVGWIDNCLPSVTVSIVARDSTATGGGGAPAINNEMLGQTDNYLPSGTGENDVSIVACGNTATGGGGAPAINN